MKEYRDSVRRWHTIADPKTVVGEERISEMKSTMEAIVEDLKRINIIADVETHRKEKESYKWINWSVAFLPDQKNGFRLSLENILDRERAMLVARIERNKAWLNKNMP